MINKSKYDSAPVIELSSSKNESILRSSKFGKSLAVAVGSLTLLAGAVKASEIGADPITDGDATTTDTYLGGTTTTTVVEAYPVDTTIPTDSTEPVDTTTPVDTTIPTDSTEPEDTTTPVDTTIPTDSTEPLNPYMPTTTTLPGYFPYPDQSTTTSPAETIPPKPQDIYKDICEPLRWSNCAEYIIYNASGEQVNRVIANSDWSEEFIASNSGGGVNGSVEKTRDILPLDNN